MITIIKLTGVFKAVMSAPIFYPFFILPVACKIEAPTVKEPETSPLIEKEDQPDPVAQDSEGAH